MYLDNKIMSQIATQILSSSQPLHQFQQPLECTIKTFEIFHHPLPRGFKPILFLSKDILIFF